MTVSASPGTAFSELSDAFAAWLPGHRDEGLELVREAHRPRPSLEYVAAQNELHNWLYEQGWLARGWSPEFGGTGGDALTRAAVYDLLAAAGLGVPTTVNSIEVLAPSLVGYAPQLASRYLPELISGREAWCQGFSEPDAGSDLAALRTRAVRDGDEWVIDGQKVWSTRAYGSSRCVVLARTGTQESRNRGLSLILVDMDAPGVICRPIADMSGTEHFGEIFFEGVRVPIDRMIGEVDKGWEIAQYALQWERGTFGWIRQAAMFAMLRALATDLPERLHAQFGSVYQDVVALRLRSLATIEALTSGHSSGPQVSIDKLLLSTAERTVQDLLEAAHPIEVDDWSRDWDARVHDYLHSRSAPIYGGSQEIQLGIVASQILELGRRK